MTLSEALTVKTGDTIYSAGLPDCGIPPAAYVVTLAMPARPELGYAPSIGGHRADGARHMSVCLILDDQPSNRKALSYWTK